MFIERRRVPGVNDSKIVWFAIINMALLTEGDRTVRLVYKHGPPDGGRSPVFTLAYKHGPDTNMALLQTWPCYKHGCYKHGLLISKRHQRVHACCSPCRYVSSTHRNDE